MVYLDYSTTTPVNKEVLDSFNKCCLDYIGNSNSLHKLGIKCNEIILKATEQISNLLNVKSNEIIYTSGSSESNNLAIKGICLKYMNRGKHIITTKYEHSSIYGPIKYLEDNFGFEIEYVNTIDGIVDINDLKSKVRDDTILVSICAVNSEIGLLNNIKKIGEYLKTKKCFFHVDLTQAIGKVNIDFSNIDLASFSGHKIYGLKGIGILYKKENINIEPIIHGGKSTSIYRSGTPAHPLIVSMSKALRLSLMDLDKRYEYVTKLNEYLVNNLSKYDKVSINSNNNSIPHILNISIEGIKSETFMHALSEYDIYISTKTACSKEDDISESVYDLTKDINRAKSSLRISLSYLTTKDELDYFLKYFDICYKKLVI